MFGILVHTDCGVDRLLALLLGMRYRQVVTFKRVLVIVICFWILNMGFASAVFWKKKLLHHQAQIQEDVHQGQPNGHEPLNIARYRDSFQCIVGTVFSTCMLSPF
ncbi:hypothetical protein ACROYT_G037638 [Oculina patagonica]